MSLVPPFDDERTLVSRQDPGATTGSDAAPAVDTAVPVVYHRMAYTRYGDRTLLQIVYTVWFPERPPQSEGDILAGRHDATLMRTPFELILRERGYNVLATAGALGAYQGTVGAARRSWVAAHEKELVGFIRGYRAGIDWLYDRANREVVEAILVANIRDMTPALARRSYEILLADKGGITRDAALDVEGIRNALKGMFA